MSSVLLIHRLKLIEEQKELLSYELTSLEEQSKQ